MPGPIAFMVMPFDRKKTGAIGRGAPFAVDFDALWERVYQPVLAGLGYTPVRADADVGALIVSEMIQRLTLADLVVADISIPNANVYYEVGVRHAAKEFGCVLVAAAWAQPVFDLAQIRQVRFPLTDGDVGEAAATAAREVVSSGLTRLIRGSSPVFESVPGYPAKVDAGRLSAFRHLVDELSRFEAQVRQVRLAPKDERKARAQAVVEDHGRKKVVRESVAMALLRLLRDHVGWQQTLDYIATLPDDIARHPTVIEQRTLALAKSGDAVAAAAELEELVKREGETSERLGLLGGRYKQLYRAAATDFDRRRYLDEAIKSYERGMLQDLNNYYTISNLSGLYRDRGGEGDEKRAGEAAVVTAVACRRAIQQGTADEWARPTLLGLAFERGNFVEARELLADVMHEGPEDWKLDTTIADLAASVARTGDPDVRSQLEAVLTALRRLLAGPELPDPPPGAP